MLKIVIILNVFSLLNHCQSLTAWSRTFLEKLIVTQLVKKFPNFYRTQRFSSMFSTAHQLKDSIMFCNKLVFVNCWPLAQHPSCRTTPHWLSTAAYLVYSLWPFVSVGCLLHPQPEAPCCGDRDPLNMMSVTQRQQFRGDLRVKLPNLEA
jgi:hypothetical protein